MYLKKIPEYRIERKGKLKRPGKIYIENVGLPWWSSG